MSMLTNALRRLCRRVWTNEDGSSTIEFVIIMPVIMTIFLMSIEVGVMMTRGLMLDRGIDITMRDLRLGNLTPMTHENLKNEICDNAMIIPECTESLSVELMPITTAGWAPTKSKPTCHDRADEIKPALEFIPGSGNELMIVSACATFNPFFPTTGLAATIRLQNSGQYAMIATSAFVNEP